MKHLINTRICLLLTVIVCSVTKCLPVDSSSEQQQCGDKEKLNADGSCASNNREEDSNTIFNLFGDWFEDRRKEAEDFLNTMLSSSPATEHKDGSTGENDSNTWKFDIPENYDSFEKVFDPARTQIKSEEVVGIRTWFDDLRDLFTTRSKDESDNESDYGNDGQQQDAPSFASILQSMLLGDREETASKLIKTAHEMALGLNAEDQSKSIMDIFNFFKSSFDEVLASLNRNMGDISKMDLVKDLPFMVTSFIYYIEHTDAIKNPSWKRRMHRFHPTVNVNEVDALHEALFLADTSYADTKEKVIERLSKVQTPWELIYTQLESQPNQPAHYIALKKNTNNYWSNDLEILLVIRGTKQIGDFLSDALLDAVDYRDGKCHSGIMLGGKFIVDKHLPFFRQLLEVSKKNKIKLMILGHSLGAGTATVAGIEFNDHDDIDAKVIGFGCPSLLSRELSDSVKSYVTTVVSDADVVPRMSAASICNMILNMISFDWSAMAMRDIHDLLTTIQANIPFNLPEGLMDQVLQFFNTTIENKIKPQRLQIPSTRETPVLIPPGNCIHLYRDGVGVTATYTPCSFFDELEISRTLVDDHLIPTGYHTMFLQLMRQYHNDPYFAFWNNMQEGY